jgi:hypothetical protein
LQACDITAHPFIHSCVFPQLPFSSTQVKSTSLLHDTEPEWLNQTGENIYPHAACLTWTARLSPIPAPPSPLSTSGLIHPLSYTSNISFPSSFSADDASSFHKDVTSFSKTLPAYMYLFYLHFPLSWVNCQGPVSPP